MKKLKAKISMILNGAKFKIRPFRFKELSLQNEGL